MHCYRGTGSELRKTCIIRFIPVLHRHWCSWSEPYNEPHLWLCLPLPRQFSIVFVTKTRSLEKLHILVLITNKSWISITKVNNFIDKQNIQHPIHRPKTNSSVFSHDRHLPKYPCQINEILSFTNHSFTAKNVQNNQIRTINQEGNTQMLWTFHMVWV